MATTLYNLRIDARGHVKEAEVADFSVPSFVWVGLDGVVLSTGAISAANVINLRLDARGHIVEVGVYIATAMPPYFLVRWYKLDGTFTSMSLPQLWQLKNIRGDARGHVKQVQCQYMAQSPQWYNLDGSLAA